MNQIVLTGNVGQDPSRGKYDVSFTLATSEKYTRQDGQQVTNTTWHNITVKGNNAMEAVMSDIHKGDFVCVIGRASSREYNNRDGVKSIYNYIETTQVFKSVRAHANQTSNSVQSDDLPY